VITTQNFAKHMGIKISTANSYLKKSLKTGTIKKIGGFSGHFIYQPVAA
jgi:small subunit ribosomal protein S25e